MHQRLLENVQIVVPGPEVEKRRGRGQLVLLARFEDRHGGQWRSASSLNLATVRAGARLQEVIISVAAFVRPGTYKVLIALIDTGSGEHNFTRRTLRVSPLKNDPLPQAWNGLPPVQLVHRAEGFDAWSLPGVKDLLRLPAPSSSGEPPVRIDLLVNITPTGSMNSTATRSRNMSVVVPALKVLAGLNYPLPPPSAAVIDLSRQRIGIETPDAATLDWHAFGRLLTASSTNTIDAKSLAAESTMRAYFAREVARRAGDSGPRRWLIVLSGPLFFGRQDDQPLPRLAPDPNRHIVYLRFSGASGLLPPSGVQVRSVVSIREPMRGRGRGLPLPLPQAGGRGRGGEGLFPDDLERVLKPMGARMIPITSPESFRKALASLIAEIAAN